MDEIKKDVKPTWISTQTNLSKALEDWSNVTAEVKAKPKLAPDEQMLKDIEGIIQKIKAKLDEFAPPAHYVPTSSEIAPSEPEA